MPFEWFKEILFENDRRYTKSEQHDTERPQGDDSKSYLTCSIWT